MQVHEDEHGSKKKKREEAVTATADIMHDETILHTTVAAAVAVMVAVERSRDARKIKFLRRKLRSTSHVKCRSALARKEKVQNKRDERTDDREVENH